jgi:FkbM family methyltransferase
MPMKRWWTIRRFDLVEIVLMLGVFGVVAFLVAARLMPAPPMAAVAEDHALAKKYGPDRNSEHAEEWIVRDFFRDRRGGFFVDVGANDYKMFSNTYYLETALGWSGLAIEPQKQFEDGYLANRPRSRFLPFFVSDVSNQEATLYYVKNNRLVTSSEKQFTEQYGQDAAELKSPTITLNDLFAREGVNAVDFLSIDIELAEPAALRGLDVERYHPQLVCIEAHPQVRQQLLDYFAAHHFVVVGKYLRADTANLYFMPTASLPPA